VLSAPEILVEYRMPLTSVKTPLPRSDWRARPWGYAAVVLLSAAAAFAASLFWDQRQLLQQHIAQEAADISWVAFLAGHADKDVVEETVRALPGLRGVHFVSKEEAFDRVQKDPDLSQSLALTGRNPFPESFEVKWDPLFLRAEYLEHNAKKLGEIDGVERVAYDTSRVGRLDVSQRVLYELDLALLSVLWTTGFLLVLLGGRLLFFPKGLFPAGRVFAAAFAGAIAGAGGLAAAQHFHGVFHLPLLAAGAVAGLLVVLIQGVFQDA